MVSQTLTLKHTKPNETTGQRWTHEGEEVLVKDITDRLDFEREEEDAKTTKVGPSIVRKKIKA
jgi:hypothetical protein